MARLFSARTLIFGGLALGAAYAARNKEAVSGLLGGSSSTPEPYPSPASAPVGTPAVQHDAPAPPPVVSNLDVAGPPENTATHVPAPDALTTSDEGGIDELAEEQAAAAEAANIGGIPEAYPSEADPTIPIDEALRPLEEAGEGYSEGLELAEADLVDNAEVAGGDPIEAERQIDEVIEAQDDPFSGESSEAIEQLDLADEAEGELVAEDLGEVPPPTGQPATDVPPPPTAEEKSSAVWRISGDEDGGEAEGLDGQPTVEADSLDDEPTRSESADGA